MFRKLILLLCFMGFFFSSFAQKKDTIDVVHSNTMMMHLKENLTKFLGNVHMKHRVQNMIVWCDSLYQYEFRDSSYIEAYGNVHAIQNDSIHMYGDYMHYDSNAKFAKLRNNVKLQDPSMTLTTDHLDYNGIFEYGYYFNKGRLQDDLNTLDSEQGTYFTQSKTAVFRDSVVVDAPDYLMYSDTLHYNTVSKVVSIIGPTHVYGKGEDNNTVYSEDGWYDTGIGHAELYKNNRITHLAYTAIADTMVMDSITQQAELRRNVTIIDSVNNVIIKGDYAKADQLNDYSYVTRNALLILVGEQDSLFLHSDTLHMVKDSLKNSIIKAYYKTRFFSQDLQGLCDSMVYHSTDSLITLYKDPVVWASGNQLTGDVISMLIENNRAKEFYLKDNALMISRREDTEMYDQVKGRNITGYFRENELYMVYVDGNAETIYFPDDNGAIIGVNEATSPNIRIYIENRRIRKITFIKTTDGELNPLFIVAPVDARLKTFRWLEELRPIDKHDIFNHRTQSSGKDGKEKQETPLRPEKENALNVEEELIDEQEDENATEQDS